MNLDIAIAKSTNALCSARRCIIGIITRRRRDSAIVEIEHQIMPRAHDDHANPSVCVVAAGSVHDPVRLAHDFRLDVDTKAVRADIVVDIKPLLPRIPISLRLDRRLFPIRVAPAPLTLVLIRVGGAWC